MIYAEKLIANISPGAMVAVIVALLGLNVNCTKKSRTKIIVQNAKTGRQKGVTTMTDREKLIELLLKVDYALDTDGRKAKDSAEFIADYLLSDGWIRPPCKVGDTVYMPFIENNLKELIPKAVPLKVKGVAIMEHIPEGVIRTKQYTQVLDFKFTDFGVRIFHNVSEALAKAKKELAEIQRNKCDIAKHIESCEDCRFCKRRVTANASNSTFS